MGLVLLSHSILKSGTMISPDSAIEFVCIRSFSFLCPPPFFFVRTSSVHYVVFFQLQYSVLRYPSSCFLLFLTYATSRLPSLLAGFLLLITRMTELAC